MKNRKHAQNRESDSASPRRLLFAVPVCLAGFLLFALLFSLIVFRLPDPVGAVPLCSLAALFFSALFCGWIFAKVLRVSGIMSLLAGGSFLLLFTLGVLLFTGTVSPFAALYAGCYLLLLALSRLLFSGQGRGKRRRRA